MAGRTRPALIQVSVWVVVEGKALGGSNRLALLLFGLPF